MRPYDWIAILTFTGSAVVLIHTGWVVFRLSRSGKGLSPGQGRIFLILTQLLLFVILSVSTTLIKRGGSPEYLLVSVLVLSCCLLIATMVRQHEQLEALVDRRTAELTTANQRMQTLLDNLPAGVVFAR